MNSSGSLLKEIFLKGANYGVFRFLNQAGSLIIIPIYWNYLTPEDFGVIAIATVLTVLLQPVISIGLHGSVERFYYEYNDKSRWFKISKLWLYSLLISLSIAVICHLFLDYYYSSLFRVSNYGLMKLVILFTVFNSFQYFPLVILRVTEKIKEFGLIITLAFITNSLLILTLIIRYDMGVYGYLLGQAMSAGIWAVYWFFWMLRKFQLNLKIPVKEEFKYALFSMPIGIMDAVNKVTDKFLLDKFVSVESLGIYSVSEKFGSIYAQFNASLKSAFFPIIYRWVAGDDSNRNQLVRFSLVYQYLLGFLAVFIMLVGGDFLFQFADPSYYEAAKFIPLFLLVYYIKSFETTFGRGADLSKRTDWQFYIMTPILLILLVSSYFLVKNYGFVGAIYALLLTALIRSISIVTLAHFLYKRTFPWLGLSVQIAFFLGLYFALNAIRLDDLILSMVLKGLLSIICSALIIKMYNKLIDKVYN